MPLTAEEYTCLESFSVLYSGGLDSAAVAILMGKKIKGGVHLLTYMHNYGTFFNEWSRKHNENLRRVLGDRVHHHLINLTDTWNEVGASRVLKDMVKYKGHWVACLGCQQSMGTHTIIYNLEHGISNTFICSSVGGEYAAMSMPITREKNIDFYARYGIRYNAPLLDMGINKNEERKLMKEHDINPGWGKRRSHQGFQPICAVGFQHTLDILFDWHTTYPPNRVEAFLEEKAVIMDRIIRRELIDRGHDPDELIARNKEIFNREEERIQAIRSEYRLKMASSTV